MNVRELTGKTVLVMGLGRFGGGVDVARFAVAAGARVVVTDAATEEQLAKSVRQLEGLAGIELKLGGHDAEDFARADTVVVNPAVRPDHPLLEVARQHGGVITSQIALFFGLCPARTVGITGANGKSTTAALTAHILEHTLGGSRAKVWLGGNIGHRPLLGTLAEMKPEDVVVLELSSFQLEQLGDTGKAPGIALLTNLTPNHLDRHGTFEAYCAAKENIFRLQACDGRRPAVSIFNGEDPIGCEWFERYRSQSGRVCVKYAGDDVEPNVRACYALPGRANLSNLAGARAVARQFDLSDQAVARVLPDFKALPHRLELVATVDGVRWYNDSIATTPESVAVALEAFDEPKVVIAGGYDKDIAFDALGVQITRHAKAVVLIGQTAEKIAQAIQASGEAGREVPVSFAASLGEAVEAARRQAARGDVVLLSPACASYDMFDNFQQRGRRFSELVRQLAG